jgi:peptide/nickel transport system ATP-binding protein
VQPGCRLTGGSILFDGIDLVKASEAEKRKLWGTRIAYVAQSAAASFNPAHRLIDQTIEATNRAWHLRSDAESRADAVALLRALQLPDPETIGSRYPHQVSGGQLQRVMTAMAMSPRPDLIIFDEPTTALDVTTQVEVLAAMRDSRGVRHGRDLHHPRPGGGGADGRFHQGPALRRGGRAGRNAADAQRARDALHQVALVGPRAAQKPEVKGEDIVLSIDMSTPPMERSRCCMT